MLVVFLLSLLASVVVVFKHFFGLLLLKVIVAVDVLDDNVEGESSLFAC
jgi:hypothetical protein